MMPYFHTSNWRGICHYLSSGPRNIDCNLVSQLLRFPMNADLYIYLHT